MRVNYEMEAHDKSLRIGLITILPRLEYRGCEFVCTLYMETRSLLNYLIV